MGWVLLAITAAAVATGIAALRSGGRARRHSGAVIHPQRARTGQVDLPHRQVMHYRASGALPRWDP